MALDLLRALRKSDAMQALQHEFAVARGADRALDRLCDSLLVSMDGLVAEGQARRLAQDLALALQACLLRQSAPDCVFDAFCASRIAGHGGQVFGTLGPGADLDALLARAQPL